MNTTALIGRLTRDPDLRTTARGKPVATLRLAYDQPNDTTGYIDVTAWDTDATNAANHLTKGSEVAITGRLDWREWTTPNGKRHAHQLVAYRIDYLRRANSAAQAADASSTPATDEDIPF